MAQEMSANEDSQKKRIFIVNDHSRERDWLTNLINQQVDLHACGVAVSVLEALDQITNLKPDITVIDTSLEGGSGIRVIKQIKAHHPDLALTGC